MKKLLMVVAIVCLAAVPAYAVKTVSFSWEDGVSTVLGTGLIAPVNITNVTGPQTGLCGDCAGGSYSCPGAYDGVRYLHLQESPHTGTPEAWIACITGLQNGDVVTGSFYGYDITASPASPSLRIWGHYGSAVTCPDCPGTYVGSAGGPSTYTAGGGWAISQYTWTVAFPTNAYSLVLHARLYSSPTTGAYTTDYWVDYVSVTIPDYASVRFADFGPSAVDNTTWGAIKALFN